MINSIFIFAKAIKNANGIKHLYITKYIKEAFKEEIKEDRDLLLTYKSEAAFLSSLELASFVISVISFFIAISSFSNSADGGDPLFIILIVLVIIFVLLEIICVYPNKKILMILEEIEKEMDKKGI